MLLGRDYLKHVHSEMKELNKQLKVFDLEVPHESTEEDDY